MGGETMKKLCPKTCGLCADDDDHDHESDDDDHHDDDSVCVDDDAKAVSLLAFASDNNVDDCASFVRFAELNGLNCDNALSSLSMFMMLTEEYKTEDDLKKICCFSCSVPELLLWMQIVMNQKIRSAEKEKNHLNSVERPNVSLIQIVRK